MLTTATSAAPAAPTTSQLTLTDVSKRYADRPVLDRVSLAVKPGEKTGVIGDNGSGKSTLLRLIAGREQADNGQLTVHAPGGIGYLAQTLDLEDEATVGDAVDLALADIRELERRIRRAERALPQADRQSLAAYAELIAEFEARDGYRADARVDMTLHHLGEHSALDRGRQLGTLSGGQRSRLALAATLASAPELLLLDEPTNDLDDKAVGWLEEHLRGHRGTLVAVTHDRLFLGRVTSTVLEVDAEQRTVRRYGNGYQGFLTAKAAERARREREFEEWREEVARQSKLADAGIARLDAIPRKRARGFSGAGAFRARDRSHGAMSRIRQARERLTQLSANPAQPPPEPLRFTARIAADPEAPAAELTEVRIAERLPTSSVRIAPGERLLVTGPNGAGKTTLLRVLAGELEPDEGTVRLPERIGHLRQQDEAFADPRPALVAYANARPGTWDEHADALLATGLLAVLDLRKPVRELSAGQRRKLELARLIAEPIDLLLLDEPTNHLSPALVEELEAALADYEGALVIATHDRRMREGFRGGRLELGT